MEWLPARVPIFEEITLPMFEYINPHTFEAIFTLPTWQAKQIAKSLEKGTIPFMKGAVADRGDH